MRKLTFLIALILFVNVAFSNGLLTNTNQSAQFIRMMSRNASLGIDAVYYNPAGLIKLNDGWHFSINSQSIFQTKTIDTEFPWLNDGHYEGKTSIPVFPTAFAVYKKKDWAFSFGFGPNAGGGSATYDRGLPSFEIPLSKYTTGLQSLNPLFQMNSLPTAEGYDADLYFEGTSVIWGLQFGATYNISEMFSAYFGMRYTPGNNAYYGEIDNISVRTNEGNMLASNYIDLVGPVIDQTVNVLGVASTTLDGAINAGLLDPNATITNPEVIQIMTLLGNPDATNQEAVAVMSSTKGGLETIQGTDVSDKRVDVEQTGNWFTGIIGINITPNEFLNIGLRYENKNFLTVENNTTEDDLGLFPDESISRNDIPGIIAAGIGYTDNKWFEAQLSFNYYLDKYQSWSKNVRDLSVWKGIDDEKIRVCEIEHNSFDIALGGQFNISETFSVSAGSMYEKAGVADNFNSDFRFVTPSYVSVGAGVMWKINEQLTIDFGASNIFYTDSEVVYEDPQLGDSYDETYGKKAFSFALGLSYSIPY